ncbi:MAG TPA: ABC transporter permease [Acidimicrobiia bacterium]|nr:ABC transporter permease [Acidimicrobiia bacterium]
MARYILNRVLSGLLTLFLFVTLLFFLASAVIPGDFVTSLGIMPAEEAEALRAELGLDQPLISQYFTWLRSIFTLSLGDSFGGGPVWDLVRDSMASTLLVLGIGLLIAFILGGWLGRTAGHRRGSLLTGSATIVAIVCLTIFPPALAVAMEQGIQGSAGWFTLGTIAELDESLWLDGEVTVAGVLWRAFFVFLITAGTLWLVKTLTWWLTRRRIPRWVFLILMVVIPLLVWSQMGIADNVIDLTGTMGLLIFAVVLLTFGEVLLITKAAMDDVMLEDYVMVARAKGLPERVVRDHHAARAALLPVLSRFTVAIPYFLTGLVILEVVFGQSHQSTGLPISPTLMRFSAPAGLGTVLFDGLASQDTPLLLGALLIVGVLTLLIRIVLDVVHVALDPRIRIAGGSNGTA